MESNIIPILIFIFWFFHIQQRFFYYLYFWQVKTYCLDRFFEEIKRNKNIVFPKICTPVLILLFLLYLSVSNVLTSYLLAIFYLILGSYSFLLFLTKKWRFPVFTKKMIVIFAFGFFIWAFLSFYFWREIVFFILFFELLLPILVFLCVESVEVPAGLLRRYFMLKAEKKREKFKDLIVIGITGSYGKSSTKEFLYTILAEKYKKDKILKTEGNINTEIGVANTVLKRLNEDHRFFICEMGAYKRGEIKLSCDIVKPKIGILTGINEQHLDLFGSQENIVKGKYELIESLPSDGKAFFNAKNEHCRNLYQKTGIQKFLYGEDAAFPGGENILGAMAIAKELGMNEEEILRACGKIENKFPGIKIRKGISGLNIIDATYSANPDGVLAHLEYLKGLFGKKVIIMPCLIELGEASAEVHRKIGKKIGEICDLAIIITKDRFKEIKEGAGEKALFMENPKEIFEKIRNFCKSGDVILLESRLPKELIELFKRYL